MMLVYFAFLAYEPGDENIVLDSTLLTTGLPDIGTPAGAARLAIFPNPANQQVTIQFELAEVSNYRISIADQNGRILRSLTEKKEATTGVHREELWVDDLPPGTYFVEVQTNTAGVFVEKLVKN